MREEGIEVHPFMPVRFPAFTGKVNYRNHRKIIVIDGKVGFIGGMNFAQRYIKGNKNVKWNNVWTLKLSMIQTVGLAVITLFIGTWINKHSQFLQRMCMPAPAEGPFHLHF